MVSEDPGRATLTFVYTALDGRPISNDRLRGIEMLVNFWEIWWRRAMWRCLCCKRWPTATRQHRS